MTHGFGAGWRPASDGRWPWRSARGAALAVLVVVLGSIGAALAQPAGPNPAFMVRDVQVDKTAATAAAARDSALIEGQRTAFRRLLERLTPRAQQRAWPTPSDARLSDLVENFEVQNERTSAVRYIATLTYRFRAEEVRNLLRSANVPFAETYSKPYLVLPVLKRDGVNVLWDEPNPWRTAWNQMPPLNGLMPLRLPLGDLADISEINAEQALRGDSERLVALATRYGTAGVMVAAGSLEMGRNNRPVLQVAVSRIGGAGGDQTVIESFTAEPGEEESALLSRAALGTALAVEERWKSEQLLHFGHEAKLTATVVYESLADWVTIQRRLAEMPVVRHSDVASVSKTEAVVDLSYIGDANQLRLALAQRDLELRATPLAPSGVPWRLGLAGKGGSQP